MPKSESLTVSAINDLLDSLPIESPEDAKVCILLMRMYQLLLSSLARGSAMQIKFSMAKSCTTPIKLGE